MTSIDKHYPLHHLVSGGNIDRRHHWYVFRALNLYRLTLGTLLIGVFLLDQDSRFFGTANPELFIRTSLVYMGSIALAIATSFWRRPPLAVQTHIQALIDLFVLSILIHASGGITSNLSILLVMAIAANAILLPLASTVIAALLAFCIMLGEWLLRAWQVFIQRTGEASLDAQRAQDFIEFIPWSADELGRIGILGATFFAAALATYTLADKARRSEALARQRSQELLEMAKLNQAIVQHLQSGIIVVDSFARLRLMNDTARELLNFHGAAQGLALSEISMSLSQRLATWLAAGMYNPRPFRQDEHLPDITPNFTQLGEGQTADTLIFLEDSAQVAQRLQQIKLAALGRLTAGIAHEIRNPLASISHAAQLLGESPSASAGDRRLGQIIHDNAKRANTIIANVLDLSRRDRAKPDDVELLSWIEGFCRDFLRAYNEQKPELDIQVQPQTLSVRFDPSHLHQILWNLCGNACLHGTRPGATPRVRIAARLDHARAKPYLDVIDFGQGISEAEGRKIFEPFFTTKTQGTGLGLYISREMCEANRSQLQLLQPEDGGCCFRITFPNPVRNQSVSESSFA